MTRNHGRRPPGRSIPLALAAVALLAVLVAGCGILRSYATTRVVVAVPSSQPPPDDIAGLRVAVEAGTDAAGILEDKTDAIPVRVADVTQVRRSAVAPRSGSWPTWTRVTPAST